jgi:surface protein
MKYSSIKDLISKLDRKKKKILISSVVIGAIFIISLIAILGQNNNKPDNVDLTAPVIQIVAPRNETSYVKTQLVNITVHDSSPLSQIWYNWNGTNITYKMPHLVTFAEGINTLQVWANDSVGNQGYAVVTFTIDFFDDIAPTVNIINPTNTIYTSCLQTVNITAEDNRNVAQIWYNWNGTNFTYTEPVSITFNEGINILHAWANDSKGNIGSNSITFTINSKDNIVPEIIIINPTNQNYNDVTLKLEITASDNKQLIGMIWFNWRGINETYLEPIYVIFNQGANILNVWANDTDGNIGTRSVTFFIDSIAPIVTFVNPSNGSYNNVSHLIEITASDSDNSIDSIWFNWNGTNTSYFSPQLISFNQGVNTIYAWANDSLGNIGISMVILDIDSIIPILRIINPTNRTYNDANQILEISALDNNQIHNIWFNWNGTNYTYSDKQQITFALGINTIFIWSNDTFGNLACDSVTFTIDNDSPMVSFVNLTNQAYNCALIYVEINAIDNNEQIDSIWYNWNGTNYTYFSPIFINFNTGVNTLHAWANDTEGYLGYYFVTFIIDIEAPYVQILNPINKIYNKNALFLNISASDNYLIDKIWYNWNGINMTYFEPIIIEFYQGLNILNVWVSDTAGNLALSSVTFIIDSLAPNIHLYNPTNSLYNNPYQLLNITVFDNFQLDKIWYNWNGTNITYSAPIYIQFNQGSNQIYVWSNDSAGNLACISVSFTIDTIAPSVQIMNPIGVSFNFATHLINITASSILPIDSIWYNWNGTNVTYTGAIFISFSSGIKTLYAWANDSNGKMGYTSVTFTIDITAPSIQIISPGNTTYTTTIKLVNIQATDDLTLSPTIWYNINGIGGNFTYAVPILVTFIQGVNTLFAWAQDNVGNVACTSVTFTIDSIAPTIIILNPIAILYEDPIQLVNISAFDNSGINMIWFNWNGTNVTYINPVYISFNVGANKLQVWVNDTVGNLGYTSVSFTINGFISVWDTRNTHFESSGVNQVKLPLVPNGIYNFYIRWGDGSSNRIISSNYSNAIHTYTNPGIYTIMITGTLCGWSFFDSDTDYLKILEIKQWGTFHMGYTTHSQFYDCRNLIITANDLLNMTGTTNLSSAFKQCYRLSTVPRMNEWDMSSVTDMSEMFAYSSGFNENISNWNVSRVIDMSYMFKCVHNFNQPIGNWNVSKVRNMRSMLDHVDYFNYPIGNWDVSNVEDMAYLLAMNGEFNQPIGNWNVSKVKDMTFMFYGCEKFNQDITNWNVSNVLSMNYMFAANLKFNQNISRWDVSNVEDMDSMFAACYDFDQDISRWDVSNVKSMRFMFEFAKAFNQNISRWDVSHVINMEGMFYSTEKFNQPIGNWNVLNVINMKWMFSGTYVFNQPIGTWNVSKVTDMNGMFQGASAFNQPIGDWDVSSVTDMGYMFFAARQFNQPIGDWDISSVTDMSEMFRWDENFNQDISAWDVSSVTDMSRMFDFCRSFNQDIGRWDVSRVTNMYRMFFWADSFNQDISGWNVSSVINMGEMFRSCSSFNQPIGNWKVTNVKNMAGMFCYATSFNQPIGNWDVSHVTDMSYMFSASLKFNQSIENWNVSSVSNMAHMFDYAETFNQDLGNWDVSSVTDMNSMFLWAFAFNQDIGNWDVSKVTDMNNMFYFVTTFNHDISRWNVSQVTDMHNMFCYADAFNQPIGNWNVSSVTDMSYMFSSAHSFDQDLGNWNIRNVVNMAGMFSYSGLSIRNYDSTIIGWASLPSIQSNVNLDATEISYSLTSKSARNKLIVINGWKITDAGQALDTDQFFISVWNTWIISTGSTGINQIKLPLISTGIYNFTINWGDNSSNHIISWNVYV